MAGLWRWAGLGLLLGCAGAQTGRRVELHAPIRDNGGAVAVGASDVLLRMAGHAGVIFAGQVVAVARQDAAGFVDVRFRVDEGLRGCPQTGVYVLREWAGLWSGNADRYRVGQRLLMLLKARGPSGMSSPVGGMAGAIPLVATATEPLASGTGVAPAEDGSGATAAAVDLRWIQTRVVRAGVSGSWSAAVRSIGPEMMAPVDSGGWAGTVGPLYPSRNGEAVLKASSLATVLALLRGAGGVSDVQR